MIADNKPLSVTCKILALSAMELHDQLALAAAVTEQVGLKDQDVGYVGGGDGVGHEEVLDRHASLAMTKQPSGVELSIWAVRRLAVSISTGILCVSLGPRTAVAPIGFRRLSQGHSLLSGDPVNCLFLQVRSLEQNVDLAAMHGTRNPARNACRNQRRLSQRLWDFNHHVHIAAFGFIIYARPKQHDPRTIAQHGLCCGFDDVDLGRGQAHGLI